jgi:hypothetical protein
MWTTPVTKQRHVCLPRYWMFVLKRPDSMVACHDMKVHMKEWFRQFVYLETTSMCLPTDQVKTKGAPKYRPKGSTKRQSYRRIKLVWIAWTNLIKVFNLIDLLELYRVNIAKMFLTLSHFKKFILVKWTCPS